MKGEVRGGVGRKEGLEVSQSCELDSPSYWQHLPFCTLM